jgi:outer membrane immunogenic protein
MTMPNRRRAHRCLIVAAAVVATTAVFSSPLAAADLPVKSRADAVVQPSWTGYYVGFHGGWAWGTSRSEDSLESTPNLPYEDAESSGPLAGAQLGANWQYGNVVVGAELDGSWTSLRGTFANEPPAVNGPSDQRVHIRALATATGRLGYAMGPWLAYGKAGAAWADMKLNTKFMVIPTVYERSRFGATAGAGMEVAFLRNVSAKVEYNFLYFPEENLVFNHPSSTASIDHFVHVVKGGFNVRFGGDHMVAR